MSDVIHGDEIDAAMRRAEAGPDTMGVCETALASRTKTVVDDQLEQCEQVEDDIRRELVPIMAQQGHPMSDVDVVLAGMRVLISGAFTYGLQTGLEIERARREKETTDA